MQGAHFEPLKYKGILVDSNLVSFYIRFHRYKPIKFDGLSYIVVRGGVAPDTKLPAHSQIILAAKTAEKWIGKGGLPVPAEDVYDIAISDSDLKLEERVIVEMAEPGTQLKVTYKPMPEKAVQEGSSSKPLDALIFESLEVVLPEEKPAAVAA